MVSYEEKVKALEDRAVAFSVTIIKTCGKYTKDPTLSAATNQIIRSATSIGANYAEANNASSKADFRSKIYIAKKEAAETRYWLRILREITNENFDQLQQEAMELHLILQKIISTMKHETNGK